VLDDSDAAKAYKDILFLFCDASALYGRYADYASRLAREHDFTPLLPE